MITELFKKRLSTFYSSWRTHKDHWGNSDIIVVSTPPQTSNLRSSQLFSWLFGEDLADTTAVFTPSSIFFLCTQKSFSRLRSLGGYATEVMKIPVSVELKPRNDEGLYKLDGIIRSMRLSLNSGKSLFAADLNCPLTVGCIDNEMPKSKLLLNCVNGFENYAKYRVTSVNSGVGKLILQGDQGTCVVSDSRIDKKDIEMQYSRGVKRTMEDRMDALDKAKAPLIESLGKLEKPNQSALVKAEEKNVPVGEAETSSMENNYEKMTMNNFSKFEKDKLEKEKEEARKLFMVLEQKLTLFYSSWRKYRKELWRESEVLVITALPSTMHHSISSSFFLWLFGHDFPKTTAVFMDQAIDFICPNESFPILCSLGPNITKAAKVSVSIQQKVKADDELELIDTTLYALRARGASDRPVIIGYIDGESPKSRVLDCCVAKLDKTRFQAVNVISGFVKLLNEGGGLESLQKLSLDTPEDDEIENLAENYEQMMSLKNCNNAKHARMVSNALEKDELLSQEKNVLLEEVKGNLPSKFAEMNILVEAIEDGRESKPVAEKKQHCESSNENPCKESVVSKDDEWEIVERQPEGGEEADIAINRSRWRSWIGKAFS